MTETKPPAPEPSEAARRLTRPAASKAEGVDAPGRKPQVKSNPVPLSKLLGVSIPVAVVLIVLAWMVSPMLAVVVLCAVVLAGVLSMVVRWLAGRSRVAGRRSPALGSGLA